ncbi:MAG: hypothetical protein K1X51_09190 [Rhodospirillaceae bacterium]|nr:hypothetical protein [Rhodospirillaceae bacterium]
MRAFCHFHFTALFIALGLAAGPAGAAQLPNGVYVSSAGDLETQCVTAVVLAEVKNRSFTADERQAAQFCAGYFSSLNDMLMALRDDGLNPFGICYPAQPMPPVTPIKAFIAFVNHHQEARRSLAMPVALAALAETFPCDRVKPK